MSPDDRFATLLLRNRGRIHRICRSWSRSPAELEDLVAEVHLQLWRSLPGFEGRSSEDTWLYRVALNTVLLDARRRGRRAPEQPLDEADALVARAPGIQARLEENERATRLHGAIRQLGDRDRTLLTLWLEELPYRRIAEITGLDENRVAVGLHRAKERLRHLVEHQEEPHE
jgi:RNA polymerase sigma-70 factor (ECF subfamily)